MARTPATLKLVVALLVALTLSFGLANYPIEQLRVGINTMPRTIEPFFDTTNTALGVYRLMFDTLVQVNEAGQPSPLLATGWQVTDDGAWEFSLQEGVTFHDGTAFTAADVKYSLDWVLNPDNTAPWAGRIGLVSGVEVVDDYTVRLTTKEPYAALLQGLMVIHMVPEGYYEGDYSPSTQPVGTGRYRFAEWAPDDYLAVTAVEDSWHGETTVGAIRFIEMPTANTRTSALRAGEIDVAYAMPPEQTADLERAGLGIDYQLIGHSMTITLVGARSEILADKRVRQAMNYAVDKEAIVEFLMEGFGRELAGQLVGPDGFGFSPDVTAYPYDPERARELLAEAGYPDGFSIGFSATNGNYLKDREVAQAVADMLREVGIDAQMEALEQSVWAEGLYSNTLEPMFMIAWQYSPAMDAALPFTYFQCAPASFADYLCNQEFDALMDAAQQAFDVQEREALLQQAAAVLREEAPILFLHQMPAIFGVAKGLEGIRFNADNTVDYHEARYR